MAHVQKKRYQKENKALRNFIETRSEESATALFPFLTQHAKAICFNILGYLDEDLVAESVVKAFTSIDSFDGRALPSTWFHKLASRVCLDEIRRKKLDMEVPWTEEADLVVDYHERLENTVFLGQIIKQASEEEREFLIQRLQGNTFAEIGKSFDHAECWAARRWKTITKRLRDKHCAAGF